jgi:hypothetical protein
MRKQPRPFINFNVRISLETEALRRRLQAETQDSASQLVSRALLALESALAAGQQAEAIK